MGFLGSAKKFAAKTKLQGEVMVIDRELKSCKAKHAVILYDKLLERHEDQQKSPMPVDRLEAAFIAAMEDMQEIVAKRRQKDDAIDALEETKKKEAESSRSTTSDKAKHVGKVLQNESALTKLKAEMTYYGREMKLRKEIFGIQVFDDLDILSFEGSFDEGTDGIGASLNQAKDECNEILKRKRDKEEDIKALN